MKPSLLIIAVLLACTSFSQNTITDTTREEYCIVRTYDILMSGKIQVSVDYGQRPRQRFGMNIMRDERGDNMKFLSEVDALNYFGADGWVLVNAFPVVDGRDSHTRYLFKRKYSVALGSESSK
jgi:hypothetical protein